MIKKVVQLGCIYVVQYGSGRTRTFTSYRDLPRTVKQFIDIQYPPAVERYGNFVNALIYGK